MHDRAMTTVTHKTVAIPFEQPLLTKRASERHGVVHDLISEPEWDHAFDFASRSDPKAGSAVEPVVEFLKRHTAKKAEPS